MFHIYLWNLKYGKNKDESKFNSTITFLFALLAYPTFTFLTFYGIFRFETIFTRGMNLNRINNYKIMTIYWFLPQIIVYLTYWLINRKKIKALCKQFLEGKIELTKKDKIYSRIFYFGAISSAISSMVALAFRINW
jgi:hypothetical protein